MPQNQELEVVILQPEEQNLIHIPQSKKDIQVEIHDDQTMPMIYQTGNLIFKFFKNMLESPLFTDKLGGFICPHYNDSLPSPDDLGARIEKSSVFQ